MKELSILLLFVILIPCTVSGDVGKLSEESFESGGTVSKYFIYVPTGIEDKKDVPLLVTFHGSRRRGHSLVERWKDLAEEEGIIVAGPNSMNPVGWTMPEDGPQAVYDLVEHLKQAYLTSDDYTSLVTTTRLP